MDDLFDILDSKEPAPVPASEPIAEAPKQEYVKKEYNNSKSDKKNLWEDEIDPVEINKDSLLRFNRMFTVASHGEVPGETLLLIDQISKSLHAKGFTFRYDGNTQDKASTAGFNACKERSEIYLPWKTFNKDVTPKSYKPSEKAYGYASGLHKTFNKLPPAIKAILARNIHVLMGDDCNTPVNMLLIYTSDGAETKRDIKYETTGNMAFFIYVCEALDIPVFNLKNEDVKERIITFLSSIIRDK